jgi:hypothetical protein
MGDPTVGWIAAIIIGGIAGWLAEQFMKSDMGLLMNIVLGIVDDCGHRLKPDGVPIDVAQLFPSMIF